MMIRSIDNTPEVESFLGEIANTPFGEFVSKLRLSGAQDLTVSLLRVSRKGNKVYMVSYNFASNAAHSGPFYDGEVVVSRSGDVLSNHIEMEIIHY